jgi:DNA polymerase elongation subunit (family B)
VSSYYPNLAIANSLFPLHLGELFPVIYKDVYGQRKSYVKGSPENAMLKLALNCVFGDSNNKYSVFFDTQYTMSITVNGQLLLCMLAEQLMRIPGLQMIQANTDGLTVRIPRTVHEHVKVVCRWWEGFTHLELEEAEYAYMHIRDANAYIGRYSNGKIKRKGPYRSVFNPPNIDKGLGDLEWHQDHSALVIPMAVESALINDESVADFIHNHDNLFDFMLRTKIPRSSRLVLHGEQGDAPLQNVCRYFVSKSGGSLVKIMPPLARKPDVERRIGICVGWRVSETNDITQAVGSDIDFDYYISEAEKLLKPLQEVVR